MLSEKRWPPEQVLQLLVRLFASLFFGIVLVSWVGSTKWLSSDQLEYLTLVVSTVSFHGIAFVLISIFLRNQAISWEEAFGLLSPPLGRALLLAGVVALAALPIAWSLGQVSSRIMELFHLKAAVQEPVKMLQKANALPTKLVIGLLALVVAPCAEELVFRGLIYPTIKQAGFPRLALWGTSLLFALIHANLMTLLPLTFLAVVLTMLYESTDNLLAPICAHSVFNFVNFIWVLTQPAAFLP